MDTIEVHQIPPEPLSFSSLEVLDVINIKEGPGSPLLSFIILAFGVYFVHTYFRNHNSLAEPTLIHQRVPLIGHLYSLHQHGLEYFDHLRKYA